ncbi:MAG: cupin domain-containing protein [Desulfobacteraceae bacterium]|nr:cupin domain-containing protein [Desulfobacteraceae bacterium]MBC2750280.1 cupin domain-containing protein [Desulfobacteraceae bacterium]
MSRIDYLRIYADADGCSHFEIQTVGLETKDYAPPAPPLNTSALASADNSLFLELPVGWYGDWHPTPVRQWLILMSGECEFEAGDGERAIRKAGDVVMLDDTMGKGHQTKVLGKVAVRMAAIHFS